MQRSLVSILTVVLVVAAIPAGSVPAAADGFVSVSTTVSPSQPVPEESFTIQTTVSNSEDSDSDYTFEKATVRREPGRNSDLVSEETLSGGIGPGKTKTLDIEATLNETGTHTVYLHLKFRDDTGDVRRIVQPVTVQVIEGHPQADTSTDASLPGDDQTLTVGVSNGLSKAIRNVEVTLDSDTVDVRNPRRVIAAVQSGSSTSLEFRVTPESETTQPVNVTINYTYDGDRRSVVRKLQPDFTETSDVDHPQVGLTTSDEPTGEEQTMTVSVSNGLEDTIRNVELIVDGERVSLRDPRRVTAAVQSGQTTSFDIRATPDREATLPVNVTLRYTVDGERREVVQTLTADFTDTTEIEHPQVGVSAESAAPGEPRTVTLTLSNGLDSSVRNVELTLDGEQVTVSEQRRVAAAVAGGGSQAFEFTVTPETAAELPLTVDVSYTYEGERRNTSYTLDTDFTLADEPAEHPQVEMSVQEAIPGATRSVNVTVANGLDRDVRQLAVVVSSPAVDFETTERVRSTLKAGGTAGLTFDAVVDEAGTYPVNVTLVYMDEGIRQRITRTFDAQFAAPSNPGDVTLTGVSAVARAGSLELSATASNVGSDNVDSVVVSIPDSETVAGTDYFVGGIDASDFSSFTLETTVTGNLSTVPVEVTYVVDGVRQSFTTEVPVEQQIVRQRSGSSGGGLPVVPAAVVGVLVIVLAVAYRVRG